MLVDGPALTAEVIGGLVVLSVFAVHTADTGKLGVEARTHAPLVFLAAVGELALCTVVPPRMGLQVGAVVPPRSF